MRESTCSVDDVSNGGRSNPVRTALASVSPDFSPTQPLFACCVDPHCGCARCLAKCDADAAEGRIPLNGAWWFTQRAFVVEYGAGARVGGFFADGAR